jgi:hypothetical protein
MTRPTPAINRNVQRMLTEMLEREPTDAQLANALRLLAKWRSQGIADALMQRHGNKVLSGPFEGMLFPLSTSEGAHAPRLVGSYERVLAPVIEEIIAGGYARIIDVGSAEGYYAVGLARRMSTARIIASDTNPVAQAKCAELAEMNGVRERIEITGAYAHEDFNTCTERRTAIICDIEGAEDVLLDPDKAPGLRHADILVETHERLAPGVSTRLTERFAKTHDIKRIEREFTSAPLPDWMRRASDLDRLLTLWEWRGGDTPWLWMTAHERPET